MAAASAVPLTDGLFSELRLAKVYHCKTGDAVNSMDFTADGELLITSSDDETISMYNMLTGELQSDVSSKLYGCDLVRFTHNPLHVLFASKPKTAEHTESYDQSIRLLDVAGNHFLRYFKGHQSPVTSLAFNPTSDEFVSASSEAVRLWTIDQPQCLAQIKLHSLAVDSSVVVDYDPAGLAIAVAGGESAVRLYDIRYLDRGPFAVWQVPASTGVHWSNVSFSPEGGSLLLATKSEQIYMIDAFNGAHQQTLRRPSRGSTPLNASWSPDGRYVIGGDEEGLIHVWNRSSGREVAALSAHAGPVRCALMNPKFLMMASGCSATCFWLRDETVGPLVV